VRVTLEVLPSPMAGSRRTRRRPMPAACLLLSTIFLLLPSRSFAAVTVTISPTPVNLPANGSQQFAATVTGASDTSVIWTVREGSSGGTVSNSGLYSAPARLGTYHVVATSNADQTQSAVATVAVPGFIPSGLLYAGACTATLLPNGTVLYTGGQPAGQPGGSTAETSNAEIYDPLAFTPTPTGNMTMTRCDETATLLPNGKVLFAGGQTAGVQTSSAELYDSVAGTFTPTGSMSVARVGHTATLLPNGTVLIAGGYCGGTNCFYNTAELYDPNSGTFTLTTGNLMVAAASSSATLLQNGSVLIAGGFTNGGSGTTIAELYNPGTGLFTQTGAMVNARAEWFTATLLQNGNVLFTGGEVGGAITSTAEIYTSSTGTFAATGSLNIGRKLHSASLLLNGQVLIAGGDSATTRPANAELYDPGTATFTLAASLQETRAGHTATSLANGTVLIAAGSSRQLLGSIEAYDPAANVFNSQSVFMKVPRTGHSTTQLADGRLLLTGGQDAFFNVNSSAETYDPATGTFSLTGSLIQGRYGHTATLLGNGNVLIVGGYSDAQGHNLVPSAELYNPVSGTFSLTFSSPNIARAYQTATALQNGMVLIAGGQIASQLTTTNVELYNPLAETFAPSGNMSAPRYNHTATLLNDGRVLIAEGVSGSPGAGGNQVQADDVYDPVSGVFTPAGPHSNIADAQIIPFDSVLLASGQILVDEGSLFDPNSNVLSTFNAASTLPAPLQNYKFVLLASGQVFVAGGTPAAYLFDPTLETYSSAGTMEYSRTSPTAKLLSNGAVLIAGGADVAQAEFFVPPAATSSASPILSLINPAGAVAGGSGFTLNVYGLNFVSGSFVNFNGVARPTTFVSATQLTIAILGSDVATAGTAAITVTNPAGGPGGGGTSNPVTMSITSPNVQPITGPLSPASATAGGPAFTLTLSGNSFTPTSVVSFNGIAVPSTFVSVVELQASIPASAIAAAGTPIVSVANPSGFVATFTVNNPVPQATQLSPSGTAPGGAAIILQVTGSNFNASSSVLVNGATITTTLVSSTLLQGNLPASDLAQGGTLTIAVNNPAPGGGTTSGLPFKVALVVVADYSITAVTTSETVIAGQPAPFSLMVAPTNGIYGAAITLTAAGLPAAEGMQASFLPSQIIQAGSGPITMVISTTSRSSASSAARRPTGIQDLALFEASGGMLILFWLFLPAFRHGWHRPCVVVAVVGDQVPAWFLGTVAMLLLLFTAGVCAFQQGCSTSNGSVPATSPASVTTPTPVNIAGNWTLVTASSNPANSSATITGAISQNGAAISGSLNISGSPCAKTGSIAGTTNATSVTATLNEVESAATQAMSLNGTVASDGNSANGTYSAASGGCTNGDTGTWVGTRSGSGSNPSGTPAGTYTITVTATSGAISHSTSVTLTVQ
jgi:hypothetical protein